MIAPCLLVLLQSCTSSCTPSRPAARTPFLCVDGPGCDQRILAAITTSRSASAVKPSPAKTRPPPAAERALSVATVAAAI